MLHGILAFFCLISCIAKKYPKFQGRPFFKAKVVEVDCMHYFVAVKNVYTPRPIEQIL